jgi:site-specific recombinase XerD
MQTELSFESYLIKLKHTSRTIKSYLYTVECFLSACPKAALFNYKQVSAHIGQMKSQYKNIRTVIAFLAGIKKYYDYLIEAGVREDHPCRTLFIRGSNRNSGVIHADLFSSAELELLLDRQERYPELKLKNQAMISLLIYQGLAPHEITNLKTHHINLDLGTIYVKESRTLAKRHLEIVPKQYRILDRYITDSREELISTDTDVFLVGKLGTPITVDDTHYIVSTYKGLFPDRNLTPMSIRQSVIANWLNEKNIPLEQVQLLAGHRWVSSTIKYRQNNHLQQRELINKWHPLG